MTPALMAVAALAAYAVAVALILGAISLTDRDAETRERLTPGDDLMAVADAVQDPDVPQFVRDYIATADMALWELAMPVELQDPALGLDGA